MSKETCMKMKVKDIKKMKEYKDLPRSIGKSKLKKKELCDVMSKKKTPKKKTPSPPKKKTPSPPKKKTSDSSLKCLPSKLVKYINRKGPPIPAKTCKIGTIKHGNDGLLYIIKSNARYKRWQKYKGPIGTKMVKKSAKKLFKVSLANKYKPSFVKSGKWFISRKLDGVRCVVHVDVKNKKVTSYSRTGLVFETLGNLENEILNNITSFDQNYYIDGEIVNIKDGKESFKGIMQQIRRKNYTIPSPKYYAFDLIKEEDFEKALSKDIFSERMNKLNKIMIDGFQSIEILEQVKYTPKDFEDLASRSAKEGWEGLMLRKDTTYKGKRSNELVKYKLMNDAEFRVIGVVKDEPRKVLSAIIIDYNNTKVGSGFSLEEKIKYYNDPSKIIGKIITVQYFEKTEKSLRFPIFKGIHGEKREI